MATQIRYCATALVVARVLNSLGMLALRCFVACAPPNPTVIHPRHAMGNLIGVLAKPVYPNSVRYIQYRRSRLACAAKRPQ